MCAAMREQDPHPCSSRSRTDRCSCPCPLFYVVVFFLLSALHLGSRSRTPGCSQFGPSPACSASVSSPTVAALSLRSVFVQVACELAQHRAVPVRSQAEPDSFLAVRSPLSLPSFLSAVTGRDGVHRLRTSGAPPPSVRCPPVHPSALSLCPEIAGSNYRFSSLQFLVSSIVSLVSSN